MPIIGIGNMKNTLLSMSNVETKNAACQPITIPSPKTSMKHRLTEQAHTILLAKKPKKTKKSPLEEKIPEKLQKYLSFFRIY